MELKLTSKEEFLSRTERKRLNGTYNIEDCTKFYNSQLRKLQEYAVQKSSEDPRWGELSKKLKRGNTQAIGKTIDQAEDFMFRDKKFYGEVYNFAVGLEFLLAIVNYTYKYLVRYNEKKRELLGFIQ